MNTLATKYDPKEVEDKWYKYWTDHDLFKSVPDEREPYTIVIPPPNVTGVLHMGHMLNETIQDILVRRARMEGKNACWVPGTDHASIATEAKVVNRLAQQGIRKSDLTRDEFLKHAWDWTHEHGGIILKQLRRLGASCDWSRTSFTLIAEPVAQLAEAPNLTPQQQTLARLAHKNVKIIRRLIDQILDFRKYENGKLDLHLTETDFSQSIRDWVDSFAAAARKRHIHLSLHAPQPEAPLPLAIDAEKMERLFLGLAA